MNPSEIMNLIAGFLQFGVACYALRLNRLFGTARVGWPLFSAFGLLALLHLCLSVEPFQRGIGMTVKVDLIYALISSLLLAGMMQLESKLKERARFQEAEHRARLELQSRVNEQTTELTRANEELRESAARLTAEIEERKQIQEQMQKTHKELLDVSRQAGMSEVATGVLHNVGNVLNSVNVSATLVADHLAESRIANLSRVADMIRAHIADLGDFVTKDPRGKQLPDYLVQLAAHLADEQAMMLREMDFVKSRIQHIKDIVATQQNYGKVSGLTEKVRLVDVVEDVLRLNAGELAKNEVQIHRDYSPHVPEIIVDKHKVLQILLNLLTNAKHACVDSGQKDKCVTVRVTNGDDKVRVVLTDNGVGIPTANLKKIFNHGFTTRKKGGHGFGLHSGALAAREMGGVLSADSEGRGKGATFTLELPLQPKRSS